MRVLLVCAAGMSTSLLVNNMKKVAEEGTVIEAHPVTSLEGIVKDYDVVLVGPQIRYKFDMVNKTCKANNVAAGLLDMTAYGRMDGAAAMKQAKELAGRQEK